MVINLKGFDTGAQWQTKANTTNTKIHDPNVIEADYVVKDD